MIVPCDHCGKPVSRHPSRKQPHSFCDHQCYGAFYSREYVGPKSKHWRGGRGPHNAGYIRLRRRGHPMADPHGDVLEHRLVMAEHLGRMLTADEVVHHINGDRADNRIENLQLFASNAAHMTHHGPKPPRFCHCGRKYYGRGMCINHYMQWHRRQGRICTVSARPSDSTR
jgi:hypothetical protein